MARSEHQSPGHRSRLHPLFFLSQEPDIDRAMSDQLLQRSGVVRRRYSLVADGIRTTESSLTGGKTVTIPYEVVFGELIEVWTASRRALVLAIVLAGLSVITLFVESERFAWLFWAIGACFAGTYYIFSRHDQIGFYDDNGRIMFYRDRPSAPELDAFLVEIRRRARERVRTRLLPLRPSGDPRLDRDRIHTLRDKGIISAQECAEFERELAADPLGAADGQLAN